FDDSAFVAPNDLSGECLKDFNQLKRAAFVFRSTCAVPGHVRKPDGSQAMVEECPLHSNSARSSMYRDATNVEPHSSASISLRFFLSDEFPFAQWATIFSFVSPRFSSQTILLRQEERLASVVRLSDPKCLILLQCNRAMCRLAKR